MINYKVHSAITTTVGIKARIRKTVSHSFENHWRQKNGLQQRIGLQASTSVLQSHAAVDHIKFSCAGKGKICHAEEPS